MLLHDDFWDWAEREPHRVAIVRGQERATYGELARQAWGIARALQESGIQKGDRVALFLENGGGGRRVHAAGHGHGDQAGLGFGGDRQRKFELSGFGHQAIN